MGTKLEFSMILNDHSTVDAARVGQTVEDFFYSAYAKKLNRDKLDEILKKVKSTKNKVINIEGKNEVYWSSVGDAGIYLIHNGQAFFSQAFLALVEELTELNADYFGLGYDEADSSNVRFFADPYLFALEFKNPYFNREMFWPESNYVKLVRKNLSKEELLTIFRACVPRIFENEKGGICLVDGSIIAATFEEANLLENTRHHFIPFFIKRTLRRKGLKLWYGDEIDVRTIDSLSNRMQQDAVRLGLIGQETVNKLQKIAEGRHVSPQDVKDSLNEQERIDFGLE